MDHPDEGLKGSRFPYLILLLLVYGAFSCKQPLRKMAGFSEQAVDSLQASVPDGTLLPTDTPDHRKVIYLSFDDGPNNGTRVVHNILRQEQVPATFFLIGIHAFGSPFQHKMLEELKQDPSLLLCNHSFTHGFRNKYELYYNHPDSVVKDFRRNADSLHFSNNIARTPSSNIWRLPKVYGDYYKRRKPAADSLSNAGFQLVGWDWEWSYNSKFELKQTADELFNEISGLFKQNGTKIKDHLVLLAHDHTFTDATDSTRLISFIQKVKASGEYRIALLNHYPGLEN
ncbi:polysaccharide deacetylase family protein [Parasegetibacter sp. NRK P23]|uniref:polysaccharide deacetylase family protein n=1 Tax=Parasegetibacter sp. NRK P23 TaxID=2942999 RepID=UPI0020441305|nr:polysaccharide deacetylase family protein [Parasegetibacter sp. NRK P23]MCM5530563.1 polysaccharide deacetylase family protein [Parasegetibacter sp. NRK P23]